MDASTDPQASGRAVATFADDLLRGADQIAEFLFGSSAERRQVYYLAEKTRLPVFRMGKGTLCARKSTLIAWVEQQEQKSVSGKD